MAQIASLDRWWRATLLRDSGAETFGEDLERQCRRIMVPGVLLCVSAWLPYLWLDRQIHPELPMLPLLRGGLSVVALVVLTVAHLPAQRVRSTFLASVVLGWLQVGAGTIAGLTGGEPSYVGGFILLLAIGPAIPLPRRIAWSLLAAAFAAMAAALALVPLPTWSARLAYSWTDLMTAGVVSALLIYAADAVRRESWERAGQIRAQNAALERALLAPVVHALPLDGAARARAEWREEWVLVCVPAGQVDLARVLPAQALAAEVNALGAALDSAAAGRGLIAAEALDGARVYVGGADAEASAATLRTAAGTRDAALAARGLPTWQVGIGIAHGPIVLARGGGATLAYDVWHHTLATARAAAANALMPVASAVASAAVDAQFAATGADNTIGDGSTHDRPRPAALQRGDG